MLFAMGGLKNKVKFAKNNETKITGEPGMQELLITRGFDAPHELVFRAYTDPELYVQWLGPRRLKMTLEKFEPTNGGPWRYIHIDEDRNEYAFHREHHEVSCPERSISTFEFEGLPEPGHVSLETTTFEELPGGKTWLMTKAGFQSVADPDGMLQSGLEKGVNDSHDRLDELLAKCRNDN
jgi:uncharacterized protein YndB with AHSA1/START domain